MMIEKRVSKELIYALFCTDQLAKHLKANIAVGNQGNASTIDQKYTAMNYEHSKNIKDLALWALSNRHGNCDMFGAISMLVLSKSGKDFPSSRFQNRKVGILSDTKAKHTMAAFEFEIKSTKHTVIIDPWSNGSCLLEDYRYEPDSNSAYVEVMADDFNMKNALYDLERESDDKMAVELKDDGVQLFDQYTTSMTKGGVLYRCDEINKFETINVSGNTVPLPSRMVVI
jgi:hypothetical protein